MKIKANQTAEVLVDVNPITFIEKMFGTFKYKMPGSYINKDGFWETWEKAGGSGITDTYREATEEEKEVYNAFRTILKYIDK